VTEDRPQTPIERPDLNGRRLVSRESPEVWLVFHGRRHLIPDAEVHGRLFASTDLTVTGEIEGVIRGPDIHPDAVLICAGADGPAYLLTAAYEGGVRKHLIPDDQAMELFEFDRSKALVVPPLVLGAIPAGRDLTGQDF
jgi:hypothetical protein